MTLTSSVSGLRQMYQGGNVRVRECLRCEESFEPAEPNNLYCLPCQIKKKIEKESCNICGRPREYGKRYCEDCCIKQRRASYRLSNSKRPSRNKPKPGADDFFVYPEVLNRIALAAVENCPKDYDCDHPLPIEGKERMPCILSGFCPHYKQRGVEVGRTA
jgi:hypothetical protein